MRRLSYIRYLTYAVLLAVAVIAVRKRHFIEVSLASPPYAASVDISGWCGENETSLRQRLVDCQLWRDVAIKTIGDLDSGVRAILEKERPDYRGRVRRMTWTMDLGGWNVRSFEIYLIEDSADWIIFAARSWDTQMTG